MRADCLRPGAAAETLAPAAIQHIAAAAGTVRLTAPAFKFFQWVVICPLVAPNEPRAQKRP